MNRRNFLSLIPLLAVGPHEPIARRRGRVFGGLPSAGVMIEIMGGDFAFARGEFVRLQEAADRAILGQVVDVGRNHLRVILLPAAIKGISIETSIRS